MLMSEFLAAEWVPALGCTEPAAVAYAAAMAAGAAEGPIREVKLRCDPRIYKNCYAVGLPNAEGKTGILWALAIGANVADVSLGLQCFSAVTPEILERASRLLENRAVMVEVDTNRTELFIDIEVSRGHEVGHARIEGDHANLTRLECNGHPRPFVRSGSGNGLPPSSPLRDKLAGMDLSEICALAWNLAEGDRARLLEGAACNMELCLAGTPLLPERVRTVYGAETPGMAAMYVQAGVAARMSGVSRTAMTLAGSGNKGITASVPIWLHGKAQGVPEDKIAEALGLACLITSAATHHLGTLSAACGSAIAAGAGIAAGLVRLEGGGVETVGLAISNVASTLAGMICDGAKVGCGMKTAVGVEAAFRAAFSALAGEGIPISNGIVGKNVATSLRYLGAVVSRGMAEVDSEILRIMQEKLKSNDPG